MSAPRLVLVIAFLLCTFGSARAGEPQPRGVKAAVARAWNVSVERHPIKTTLVVGLVTGTSAALFSRFGLHFTPEHALELGALVAAKAPLKVYGLKGMRAGYLRLQRYREERRGDQASADAPAPQAN